MPTAKNTKVVRLSKAHLDELHVLKVVWDLHSLDDVVEELIRPRRIDKIKVLNIKEEK